MANGSSTNRPNRRAIAGRRAVWVQPGTDARSGPTGGITGRGFTLLEVLLALALFASAVVVLTGAYLNCIEGLAAVRLDREFEQEVRWVREQVLLQADREEVAKGGEVSTPSAAKLSWTAEVQSAPVIDLFTVELQVTMVVEKEKPREHHERLTVLRPSWSEPTERGKLLEEAKTRIEEDRRRRGIVAAKTP
jgi:prepilin-type N-terminal cleavage/methylation domain-containing protein